MRRGHTMAWILALGGLTSAACTGSNGEPGAQWKAAMGWPQLELEQRGGDHGGRWTLRVDHEGHYVYDSSDDTGGGTVIERVCGGSIDVTQARAWLDRVSALPLVPYDGGVYSKMAREHPSARGMISEAFEVVYWPSKDVSQMPADLATYEQVRDEAKEWFRARPENDPCEETKRKR